MKLKRCRPLLALVTAGPAAVTETPRERVSFNAGWRFISLINGDAPNVGGSIAYERVKVWVLPTGKALRDFSATPVVRPTGNLGEGVQYVHADFEDRAWRRLDRSFDEGIEGPFQQEFAGDTGKLPWFGVAWYRKTFTLPAGDAGRRLHLDVDGAMSYAPGWCNGQVSGGWPYGYPSGRVDLTPICSRARKT